MGQASQPSLNKWYYELQRQKDNLGYRAYLLQAIEEYPLRARLSKAYQTMIVGWKHTQKDIQRDICTMDADSFVSMSYYMLTCFDEKSDDDVRNAAKKYLPYYAPENNTEKLDGTIVKTALFDMLRSANA
ncbi:MAG: hypothetical protein J6T37_04020 [Bacteroidales bacterium]|nr:hypothetical protein [Bacteroidales bacterium]